MPEAGCCCHPAGAVQWSPGSLETEAGGSATTVCPDGDAGSLGMRYVMMVLSLHPAGPIKAKARRASLIRRRDGMRSESDMQEVKLGRQDGRRTIPDKGSIAK
jgi:hypothetical protein